MPGSVKKFNWVCDLGHTWDASPNSRTNNNSGCPFCGNKKVLAGFNDLRTKYPKISKEAFGWDPSKTLFGSKKKLAWKCSEGHIYETTVILRTGRDKTGCPFCSNRKVLTGFNNLKTKFPALAEEADGWDPGEFLYGSDKSMRWHCIKGHSYDASISSRLRGRSCGYCAGKKVLAGFNDLQTKFPSLTKEADGWDPSKIMAGSSKKLSWKCNHGHSWMAVVSNRTTNDASCPFCSNKKLLPGFNDLQTRFPELAIEAYGWDPNQVMPGNSSKRLWRCKKNHKWKVSQNNRTGNDTGCSVCAESGFNPGKYAWFYLLKRPGELQIGITNNLERRLKYHRRFKWRKVEVTGPHPGTEVQEIEKRVKKWLRKNLRLVPGTSENWYQEDLPIKSFSELKETMKIETNLM